MDINLPQRISRVLAGAGKPIGSAEICRLLSTGYTWSKVADVLSEMTRSGLLRRMPDGGEYVYELSDSERRKSERVARAVGLTPVVRDALVSTAVKADSALDAYVQKLADPTLAALVDTSRTMWRTCAVAGVQAP